MLDCPLPSTVAGWKYITKIMRTWALDLMTVPSTVEFDNHTAFQCRRMATHNDDESMTEAPSTTTTTCTTSQWDLETYLLAWVSLSGKADRVC